MRPGGGIASAWGTAGASPEQGGIQFLQWVTHSSRRRGSNSELKHSNGVYLMGSHYYYNTYDIYISGDTVCRQL